MIKKNKFLYLSLLLLVVVGAAFVYLHGHNIQVLNTKGAIGNKERHLIIISTLLMLIVVIPVYILTFGIAWKYRASNKKAKYTPDWDHHPALEFAWWAVPGAIILVLSVITWRASHELDPFRSLVSNTQPMTIQVVALQWKWLFIYPAQNIAAVNFVQLPDKTPINFEITADAPMNSFWIPQLGGQIYAMPGMSTQLHLIADETGSYRGSSANISGAGFASMNFMARSSSQADFDQWIQLTQRSNRELSLAQYSQLAKPSQNNSVVYYSSAQSGLYETVVNKYLGPSASAHSHYQGVQ